MNKVLATGTGRQAVWAEILEELRYIRAHMTAAAERTGTGVVNHVLEIATKTFPTEGIIALEFGVPIGSIIVNAVGTGTVTVHAAGPQSAAPTDGIGVYKVEQDTDRRVGIGGRQVTLYGTAGQQVCYQALTVGVAQLGGWLT